MIRPSLLITALLLAACAGQRTNEASAEAPPALPQDCTADAAQWAVGQAGDDAVLERARSDAGAKTARYLQPNQPITMEYNGTRLNLMLDADGKIERVSCG